MHKRARPHRPQGRGRSLTPWPVLQASAVSKARTANEEGIAGERSPVRRWWHTGAATLTRAGRRRVEVGETSKRGTHRRETRDSSALTLGSLGSSTRAFARSGRLGYSVIGFAIQHWAHPPAWHPGTGPTCLLTRGAPVDVGVLRSGLAGLTALNWRQIKHLHTRDGNGPL